MNKIFNPYTNFTIVYIGDVLIFSNSIYQHFNHFKIFQKIVKDNGLVISAPKFNLFQTNIRFLGFEIYQSIVKPVQRVIKLASKFPNEIKDRNQLQRFLGSLNYVSDFFPNLRTTIKPMFYRLRQNPKPWIQEHTDIVKMIKQQVMCLPCLGILNPGVFPT